MYVRIVLYVSLALAGWTGTAPAAEMFALTPSAPSAEDRPDSLSPKAVDDPSRGVFAGWELGWPQDFASTNPSRPAQSWGFDLHSYGERVDLGISVHSFYGEQVIGPTEREDGQNVVRDPLIVMPFIGHFRSRGSFWYGIALGPVSVQGTYREQHRSAYIRASDTLITSLEEHRKAAGLGFKMLIGLMDPGSIAGGLSVLYVNSKLGTHMTIGMKIGVVVW